MTASISAKPRVLTADFITSATASADCISSALPELAIAGRSNAGKSTLLNRVCQRKNLARTSAIPGKTQLLNQFAVCVGRESERQDLVLTDLPGYGYAKVAKTTRNKLSRMIIDYISGREQLSVLCLLNECRRTPEKEEQAVQSMAFDRGLHLIVVVTKIDRLNQSEKYHQLGAIAKGYGLEVHDLLITGEQIGAAEFWERVLPLLRQ